MRNIIVTKAFKFAHFGYQVEEFEPDDKLRETSDECAELAIGEGWATDASAAAEEKAATRPRANKAHSAAPEDKAD